MKLRRFLMILILPCAGMAQTVSLGVMGGIPVTEAFPANVQLPAPFAGQTTYTSRAKQYTVGPAVEVSLPLGLALEVDALYKRLDYNFGTRGSTPSTGAFVEEDHNMVSRWDLPLLLKYKAPRLLTFAPYFSGGLNTNYIVNTTQLYQLSACFFPGCSLAPLPPPVKRRITPAELRYRSAEGVVIAGGFEFHVRYVRLASELRYTRWAHENFHQVIPSPASGGFRSNLNQTEVLVTLRPSKN
jgi:hypothetical protein